MPTKKGKPTSAYFSKIGAKGGKTTLKNYGKDYLRKLAKKGGIATRDKYHVRKTS